MGHGPDPLETGAGACIPVWWHLRLPTLPRLTEQQLGSLGAFGSSIQRPNITAEAPPAKPALVSWQPTGTSSTNAVGGPGALGRSQSDSQSLPASMSAPYQRKGTFTDDLHKLLDNWAKDAINLSQGKRSAKQQQAQPQSHSYDANQSQINLSRKYSAPGHLCSTSVGSSSHTPPSRTGSLCQAPPPASASAPPPHFIPYRPSAAYGAQWAGPAHSQQASSRPGPLPVSTSQPLGPRSPPPACAHIPGRGSLRGLTSTHSLQKDHPT
ncbi:hypothetical protein NHX12_020313 [Muraenolepis orangiensis]|uniref:Uncharacterized protein n=1 Tax=Muraenolepis orangiensis TaxID=630683 RepID=A0A9Q0ERM7_9TELE|nr:hypothetical protein NHX12_020313 [Muraenolepis orangiensis]